ncbi:MAG: hypothetical protein ACK41G_10215 [Candidatus Thermochlorobacter sp.]
MTRIRITLVMLALLLSIAEVIAQPVPGERERRPEPPLRARMGRTPMSPEQRTEFIARLRQMRMWKLTERLKMSEEQAIRFFPKYNRYQDEYFAKAQELQTQMQALRQMEERKAPDNEIDKQIEKILATRTEISGLLSKYTKDFREVLSSQQMVELVLFERDFLDDFNRLLNRSRPDTTR